MQLGLATYFDLGWSVGLTDDVFADVALTAPFDISDVGLENPLGRGVEIDLVDEEHVLELWREEAVRQLQRPELEVGRDPNASTSRADLVDGIAGRVTSHPVASCRMMASRRAGLSSEHDGGGSAPFEIAAVSHSWGGDGLRRQ